MISRRKFLKAGALFVPASYARGQVVGFNPFIPNSSAAINPVVSGWVARVVANGGATPSANTQNGLSTLVDSLQSAGVWAKMIHVNAIAADSIMAAKTPLLVGGGNDPWVIVGGPPIGISIIAQGLSINQSGASSAWNTGINPSVAYASSLTSVGATIMRSAIVLSAKYDMGAREVGGNTLEFHFWANASVGWAQAWQGVAVMSPVLGTPQGVGFISFSRTTASRLDYYFADHLTTCASIANTTAADVGTAPNFPVFLGNRNDAGGQDNTQSNSATYSFFALHKGLSLAETTATFNAAQAFRTNQGGGGV